MKAVITTIQNPTEAVKKLSSLTEVIVVGDIKTPPDWNLENCEFIPYSDTGFDLFMPENHYARKNIGYLKAIQSGTDVIYDTDDDNVPIDSRWKERTVDCTAESVTERGWCNAYAPLSDPSDRLWPRGFHLKYTQAEVHTNAAMQYRAPIQQGLADGDPDVDAIWRLTVNRYVEFFIHKSIILPANAWCPFNSQSTWWFKEAFPLMYLPCHCSFRMTDIWRSFIAQRCLWELGMGVVFHSPAEVFQRRNEHDLLKDFEQEIDGYLKNGLIVEALGALKLKSGIESICDNMITCYKSLIDIGVFPQKELIPLLAWLKEIKQIWEY